MIVMTIMSNPRIVLENFGIKTVEFGVVEKLTSNGTKLQNRENTEKIDMNNNPIGLNCSLILKRL
jgi:hypothetical protein